MLRQCWPISTAGTGSSVSTSPRRSPTAAWSPAAMPSRWENRDYLLPRNGSYPRKSMILGIIRTEGVDRSVFQPIKVTD